MMSLFYIFLTLFMACGAVASAPRSTGTIADCGSESRCMRACDGGDLSACLDLGLVLDERGSLDEAIDAYARGCAQGDLSCCAHEVATLRNAGREGEADAVVRIVCSDDESGERCREFVELIDRRQPSPEAEELFEQRCVSGDGIACRHLGNSVSSRGLLDQAAEYYGMACRAGDLEGCIAAIPVLTDLGRDDEAEQIRQRAEELGGH